MKKSDFNLEHQNHHIESKIIASLERIAQAFRILLWQESVTYALTPIQIQLLIFIHYHQIEKCKVSYLANEFNLSKATISDTIKLLEQKQLIQKIFDQNDSRSYTIKLTKKGKEIALKTSFFSEEISKPIEQLHSEDKQNMLLGLLDIIRHLNSSGVITLQRMCYTCTYYKSSHNGKQHYCNLLQQKLAIEDLRIDCPEHQQLT
ncbi:MAG: winged helix-turn-helix transcriptional regulator [Chitinophagales bacterium]|nr:winged helix-turn-helix transcriptional regulator [Chitinophagales bacterium]